MTLLAYLFLYMLTVLLTNLCTYLFSHSLSLSLYIYLAFAPLFSLFLFLYLVFPHTLSLSHPMYVYTCKHMVLFISCISIVSILLFSSISCYLSIVKYHIYDCIVDYILNILNLIDRFPYIHFFLASFKVYEW